MSENRTMIGGPIENNGFDTPEEYEAAVKRVAETQPRGETFTVLGPNHPGVLDTDFAINGNGTVYARMPEGWPAANAKDLEDAHAEAVASEEPEQDWEDQIRAVYASFSPEEVQELCEDWVRLINENRALRKGMKTMQRKTRKQAQQERRLARRLAQARAGRDRAYDERDTYKGIAKVNEAAAFELSMQQLKSGEPRVEL